MNPDPAEGSETPICLRRLRRWLQNFSPAASRSASVTELGLGHEWQMVGDDPWWRAYVIFPSGVGTQFVPGLT
jgi:hypothetical protein